MTYPHNVNWGLVPQHTQGSIKRYLDHGIDPGHFMTAVLSNDLRESFARADDINRERLFDIVSFLYADAPSACWGSPEAVRDWIGRGGLGIFEDDTKQVSPWQT